MNKPEIINYKPKKEFNFYEFIFIGIVLFIILIYFLLFIFYPYISVIDDSNKIKKINDMGCLINQCKMNRNSGEKICPVFGSRIDDFNVELEVCMDRDKCPSQQYILKDNGESNIFTCPDNKICNCTQDIRCGREIGSVFNVIKGNYYKIVDNSRYKDKDIIFRTDHSYKSFFENDLQILYHSPPISINNPSTKLCSVTQRDYKYINPLVCSRGILSLYKENSTDDFSLYSIACINEPLQIGLLNCDITTNIPLFDKTTMKFIGGVNIFKCATGENKIGNIINNNICKN